MFVVTEVYYASIIQHNLDHTLCVLLVLMFFGKAQQHETLIFFCIELNLIRCITINYDLKSLFKIKGIAFHQRKKNNKSLKTI